MPETISDTGPILHLHEIGRLPLLASVSPLTIPDLVYGELEARSIRSADLEDAGVDCTIVPVSEAVWREILLTPEFAQIQAADAQVFALVRASSFRALALTDDLPLRKLLEDRGATVVGSVGILVKAYASGLLNRRDLDEALEALFTASTLHLSRAFRAYLRKLFDELP